MKLLDLEPTDDPWGGAGHPDSPLPIPTREYELQTQSSFWHRFVTGFNVGHALILIGMLATSFWWFVTYDREFTIAKITLATQGERIGKLEDEQSRSRPRIERIDLNLQFVLDWVKEPKVKPYP